MRSDPTQLAPIFGIRTDGEAGASSASDLLITIFGELMRPNGATAWTQTFVTALGLVDVEEKAARQAISRLADKGWLTSERVGRRTRWRLTTWAVDVLERGAERIYGLGQHTNDWDATWLVLLASVPETQRSIRGPLGVRLGWAGFGSIGQGVWICPRMEREAEVQSVVAQFEVEGATLFRSEMTDIGDPVELAARAWQLDELAAQYEAFLTIVGSLTLSDGSPNAGHLIRLVDAWRHFPLIDPDLPQELRPDGWPGDEAARTFTRLRSQWADSGADWWASTDTSFN